MTALEMQLDAGKELTREQLLELITLLKKERDCAYATMHASDKAYREADQKLRVIGLGR